MKKHLISTLTIVFIAMVINNNVAYGQNFYKEKISRDNFLQAGLGLGTLYADNLGSIRMLDILLRPGLSASYGRKIHKHFDIRANIGYQRYRSQDIDYYPATVTQSWLINNQAFASKNDLLFFDVAPNFYLFGSDNHAFRSRINAYGGTGLGMLINFKKTTNVTFNGVVNSKDIQAVAYIPFRAGLSYSYDLYTDIALEGTLMMTFSDTLDGNEGFNRLNDIPIFGQIIIKRYLHPFKPFKRP
ncbi:hypothetical protein [Cyclobacterium marinum]|uniref:hypothetical protein n=1 Tax=Cyclobacterium marinum TaxID=104 RepID=UPI0011F02798|nr:hypothetical protein [Cyclobacterium marinum]MBI0399786.1 hypothetical protein [Cyclobacterium marinum]